MVLARRLLSQHLARPVTGDAGAVVRSLGAVQAQDYAAGKWAIGLRLNGGTDAAVEQAIAARTIVRTWPMRGTLHFVAAEDVRWMLELCASREIGKAVGRHRQLGLTAADFEKSRRVLVRALRGGQLIARREAMALLAKAGVDPRGQRGIHILAQLAHEGTICFGTHLGKQQSFVLLEEWVPQAKPRGRAAALAELARRYFVSHGPATVQDFAWWSGLTLTDARAGVAAVAGELVSEDARGRTMWMAPGAARARRSGAHLLPPWDEYTVAYRDRSDLLDPRHRATPLDLLRPTAVVGGKAVGTWTRMRTAAGVSVKIAPFGRLGPRDRRALAEAAERYGRFLGCGLARVVVAR